SSRGWDGTTSDRAVSRPSRTSATSTASTAMRSFPTLGSIAKSGATRRSRPSSSRWTMPRSFIGFGRCCSRLARSMNTRGILVRPGDAQAQGLRRPRSQSAMTEYREADFSRLKTVPIAKRRNKVDASLLAHPPRASDRSFAAFLDALPSILAAQDLRYVVDQIVAAAGKRAVVVMLGGHVIKVGLGPLLIALMRQRAVTVVAMNG